MWKFFQVRIEDTDQSRLVPGAAKDLERVLSWAGLKADESPVEGGPSGPYTQSERLALYQEHAQILIDTGQAYRCFCTPRRLELLKREASRTRQVNKYDRKCLPLSKEEVASKMAAGEPFTVRFLLSPFPEPWKDLVYGDVTHNVFELEGDPIILKSDGFPTYHLANVVDDHLMGITHVLRGVEWQASTPKHLLMYRAFGWTPPAFAHLPLIVNSDGSKLSKRQGDLHIESLIKEGFFPEAVVNFVSHVGGGFKGLGGSLDVCHDLGHLSKIFDLELINTNPGRLEMHRLNSLNRVILKDKLGSPDGKEKLLKQCLDLVEETVRDQDLELDSFTEEEAESYLVWACKERVTTIKELVADELMFLWALPKDSLRVLETPKSVIKDVQRTILDTETLDKALVKEMKKIGKKSGLKFPKMMEDLRVLLTGKREGPPVLEVVQVLGKDSVTRRLGRYLEAS